MSSAGHPEVGTLLRKCLVLDSDLVNKGLHSLAEKARLCGKNLSQNSSWELRDVQDGS